MDRNSFLERSPVGLPRLKRVYVRVKSTQQLWDFSLGVALKSRQNLITAVTP
ncbi:hypothetical protein [Metallosphaera yellowstonensis]|uniref:hypothetical protein n=1 Tax=Metallosphaera yellowstonensis TaxID=1111107 RepID=UPI000A9D9A02|nr:hypothetical protein [Metallosphaera yellowstonensis]